MLLKLNFRRFVWLSVFTLAIFLLLAINTQAAWQGPSSAPPNNNVPAPLNVSTMFDGDIKGTYDGLKIRIANCSSSQVLMWTGDEVRCEDINQQIGLLEVLSANPDASKYTGGVVIGTSSKTWMNIGGAFTAGWIHSVEPGNNSLAGNLGIGIDDPNSQLHIYSTAKNAEIDLQSIGGEDNHWAIYHKAETNDLRFWNKSTGDLVILGSDRSFGVNGSLLISDYTPTNNAFKLYNSGGSLYWNGVKLGMGAYLGKTDQSYSGNIGGYIQADTRCRQKFPGSHVCFTSEMVNSITSQVPAILDETGEAWVVAGPAGNIAGSANDCNAFHSNSIDDYGPEWFFDPVTGVKDGGVGYVTPCLAVLPLACCR